MWQLPFEPSKFIRNTVWGTLLGILIFWGLCMGLNWCFPLDTHINYSTIVTDAEGNILHAYLSPDDKWRMMTELPEITADLQKAIIHKEDKYFYYHFGINPIAVGRALFQNVVNAKRTSGASTITMQVARLLYPKSRTYSHKVSEMFRAIQLEWYYSKAEILQLYLNLVPYGGNIEGVKSAAVLYFGKTPNHLSLAEITALAIVPNRPSSLCLGKHNDSIIQARNKWLTRFKTDKLFSETTIVDALSEPLNAKRRAAPKLAPHFSYRMKKMFPHEVIIKTNLQYNRQQAAERLLSNHIKRLYHKRIRNAATVIIDNATMQVIAYVGSADFNNTEDAGQVDGIKAIRSPGSTLKPFLYGLAFDKGLVTPKMKISDVPSNFSGYSPVNYDGTYNGAVTMEYALANSLNIPPVKILNQLGVSLFLDKLVDAGFAHIKQQEKILGLSTVLGGCGVRLEELSTLYASFANKGLYRPLQWSKSTPLETSMADTLQQRYLLSPSGAFIITDILSQLTRPDLPQHIDNSKHLPKIAWKTGTSYGRRDAWAVGYNANYTIGVWVGNFSAEGVPELSGAQTATPLLFDLFNTVDYSPQKDWFISPKSLEFRWVCSETGLPPSHDCKDRVLDYYLPLVSGNTSCEHVKKMWVSPDESKSYCTTCRPNTGYKSQKYTVYAPEIVAFYERQNINYDKIPPHNPTCGRLFGGEAPTITAPVDGLEYLLDPLDNDQLMLACNVHNDVEFVYWYVNDQFLQRSAGTKNLFFVPQAGKNKISCVDDKGRKRDIWVLAKFL